MFDKWPVNQTLVNLKSHLLHGVIESYFANGLIHQGRIPLAGMSCFCLPWFYTKEEGCRMMS